MDSLEERIHSKIEDKQIANRIIIYRSRDDFKQVKEVGKGYFGTVFKAQWRRRGTVVALKQLNEFITSDKALETFLNEVILHLKVSNYEYINACYGICIDPLNNESCSMVLQYAEGGNLRQYLENNKELSWIEKIQMSKEILTGLCCLHAENIIHLDLHTKNILIHRGKTLISDFGLAKSIKEVSKCIRQFESPAFVEPKCFSNESYNCDAKSDIYSVGVILWEISSCRPPLDSLSKDDIVHKILNGYREDVVPGTPKEYMELYQSCWDFEPSKRPRAKEVLNRLKELNIEGTTGSEYVGNKGQKQVISHHSVSYSNLSPLQGCSSAPEDRNSLINEKLENSPSTYPSPFPWKVSIPSTKLHEFDFTNFSNENFKRPPDNKNRSLYSFTSNLYDFAEKEEQSASEKSDLDDLVEEQSNEQNNGEISSNRKRNVSLVSFEQCSEDKLNQLMREILSLYIERHEKGSEHAANEFMQWCKKHRPQSEEIFNLLIDNQNLPYSRCLIGEFYILGFGVSEDKKRAFRIFIDIEDGDKGLGYFNVALCYLNGVGIYQDYGKAFEYFEKSKVCGSSAGKMELARCYKKGIGVQKNMDMTFRLSLEAAEKGYFPAIIAVKKCYSHGIGVKRNKNEANRWSAKAVKWSDKESVENVSRVVKNDNCSMM